MATITVTSLNDSGAGSLRQAIIDATAGDTIQFDPSIGGGTIALASELLINKDLIIDGDEGNPVTIDAAGNSRVFNIDDGNNSNQAQVTIDGVNITGGFASGTGTNQSDGGGIFTNEALTLSNSLVTGNTASGDVADGGGIYVNSIGSANISNTTISNNTASDDGGGVFGFGPTNITNSTINNNLANADVGDGGGVYIVGTTTITNSTISGNTANSEGGGVYVKDGTRPDATITNTTITNNQAPAGKGSGLAAFGSIPTTTVTSSIIADNVNSDIDELTSGSNAIQSGGNNLIGTGNATGRFNATGDQTGVTNPGLDPLADNGGPTQTHALQSGSDAINAGSNSLGLTTDQRGTGFSRVLDGTADIGAFEFDPNSIVGTENVVNTLLDENDGGLNQGAGNSLRELITFANPGDTITFADSLAGNTITLTNGELVIDKNLTIDGDEGNPVTIDAAGNSRVFNIDDSNPNNQAQVTIDGVNITGGVASGSGTNQSDGGGIFTNEALTLSNSVVTGNTASGNVADGGGIYVNDIGSANISNTTISNNTATDDGGGVFAFGTTNITNSTINNNLASNPVGDGGGVYIVGTTTITNSTISGNTANSEGGGVYVKDGTGPDATITNTTITNNEAPADKGSGLAAFGSIPTTTVTSSIIAGNVNSDVDQLTSGSNAIQSGGNNLIGTTNSSSVFGGSDIVGVTNPGLEPLGDFGGPTQTHALQAGSDAINAGSNPLGLTTDQRGAGSSRVIDGAVDIGAFEFNQNSIFGTENTDFLLGDTTDNSIYGLASDDFISGLEGNDTLFGNDGNDFILSDGGDDLLFGGKGNDELQAGDGIDELFGGTGDDTLRSGLGNDTLLGETGNDLLNASDGDDSLLGGAGNDTLIGGDNSDTLDGGLGSDSLTGGAGSDNFLLRSGDGTDLISDYQDGQDQFLLDGLAFADLTITQGGSDTILQAAGEDLAILQGIGLATIDSSDFVTI